MGGGGMGGGGMGGGGMGGMMGGMGGTSLQSLMASPDDEWAVLLPRIQRVTTAQSAMNINSYGGGGLGGGGTTATPTLASALATALNDLITALNDPQSGENTIRIKLEAYRAAKAKVEAELKTAQRELQMLVTLRQEGILVWQGYLE
jgi:hypothetical protein